MRDVAVAVAVQLFTRLPWLGECWARRHRFVEASDVPWVRLGQPVRESTVALVTTAGVHLKSRPAFGHPMGEAFAVRQQRAILETALEALETLTEPGAIVEPGWVWRRHRFE
jgi:hypothetical protein